MATQEIKVPDIGGYDDVPVLEVLVAVGDTVDKAQGLVTLASEKATMEVPSSVADVVKELLDKVGDTPSERSEERRVGTPCFSTCRCRWSSSHYNKHTPR